MLCEYYLRLQDDIYCICGNISSVVNLQLQKGYLLEIWIQVP